MNKRGAVGLWLVVFSVLSLFLVLPLVFLLARTIGGPGLVPLFTDPRTRGALANSLLVSGSAAFIATLLALMLALAMNTTHLDRRFLRAVRTVVMLPMFLPTLTFGFAIMYSYGKQGLITRLFGVHLFPVYGFGGVLMGLVIYTLPAAFLLLNNAASYQDRKFELVSQLSGDGAGRLLWTVWIRPLLAVIGGAFVLAFVLSFTDYGIPAALGGDFPVLSTLLYDTILGSSPDFSKGALLTVVLLGPAVFGFCLIKWLDRFNAPHDKASDCLTPRHGVMDALFALGCLFIALVIVCTFAVMFIVPFLVSWPYDLHPTAMHLVRAVSTSNLVATIRNSLISSSLSAVLGTILAFVAAYLTVRSRLPALPKSMLDALVLVSNTVPGLVIGVSYLLTFNRTSLKGTLAILVASNIIHFLATPYMMARNALVRMHRHWETTASLLGDSPCATVVRIVLPNARVTIIEMIAYLFQNSMVTTSAVIFLVSTRTMLITTKINELQYFMLFDQVFILSLLILTANLAVKGLASISKNCPRVGVIGRFKGFCAYRKRNKPDSRERKA